MKTNIIQITIDFSRLDFSLQEFFHINGYNATYIIANQKTINFLVKESNKKFESLTTLYEDIVYKGIRVAKYNGLKFGEVDIV